MQTEAVFENISERIQDEIDKAQQSIFIAVAWFTNKSLFNKLLAKSRNGCSISLIISNDEINNNSHINFEELINETSKVYKIGNGDTELMHNKFCVIDYNTVITGSYNWSYKAENNFENVIITRNDFTLAKQFINEFNNIRKNYYPEEINEIDTFPLHKIITRLEIIKNYILLEDIKDLNNEISKIRPFQLNEDLKEIISYIENESYALAVSKIQNFISNSQKISIWIDPEIAALKLEIKILENQLNAFDNEKVELEKIVSEFQRRHTIELGEIILDILKLRKLKFIQDKTKYTEAENDERHYRKQIEEEKGKGIFDLTEDQKNELKKKFRRATVLCHPDKFANEPLEIQKQAEEIFKELNEANGKNNLQNVSEILVNLEKGTLSFSKGLGITDKDKLKTTINRLKLRVKKLETEIISIKQSETFRTILNISDWDDYFIKTKEKLKIELEELQLEIGN